MNSKDTIKEELKTFLKDNPPDKFKNYCKPLDDRTIEDEVNIIIYKIKFPEPTEILQKLDIEYSFYDLTVEDFKDKDLLEEFKERGVINMNNEKIVEIEKVFGVIK
ncbi:MAG: hypothetical protein HGGPFJEG_00497 [Ignavibacteria bacterium]|nr:hypothetical protein [Ignavibacteria bacterium]